MRTLLIVFSKEFLENLRDRRTLLSALLFGPLFGPLLFGLMVSQMLRQSVVESDVPLKLTISGSHYAPGLTQYLKTRGVKLTYSELSENEARAAVRGGTFQVVLLVPEEYPRLFTAAKPAPVLLFADSADSQTRKIADRARGILGAYGSTIAQLRLQLRGVSPLLSLPVAVNDVDVATPTGRAVVVLGFMTYFVLFALLMGGLYLAIDSTAGERERGSLEALLSLTAFVCVFRFVPLERIGMSANLGLETALIFFAICLPFVPLGAALMTLVASFTRTYREAQTYLTTVLLVPTLPIAFASIYSLKTKSSLMFIPSLSQHLLMTSVLKDEPILLLDVLVSAAASLGLALLLFVLTAHHWRRETMLG